VVTTVLTEEGAEFLEKFWALAHVGIAQAATKSIVKIEEEKGAKRVIDGYRVAMPWLGSK
jgi:hypothetical protein